MRKSQYPVAIAIIAIFAFAVFHVVGLVLAALGLTVVYLVSLRTHPRTKHTGFRSCNGTGEHRHPLFPWTFHKCPRCNGGRLIRWGAGQWGADHIRSEHQSTKAAREFAKRNSRWR